MSVHAVQTRSRFQGVTHVIRYNWPFYAVAGAAILVLIALGRRSDLAPSFSILLRIAGLATGFWIVASVLVTFFVYDVSDLYRWQWLTSALRDRPRQWAAFHAGLDETSEAIRDLYPESQGSVFDVFDPRKMTEASIQRARTNAEVIAKTADSSALPIADAALDAAFLIFAAHELRDPADRVRFFCELWRTLRPGGRIVLVEHLRDGWNLAAYGPGVWHFFSRAEWTRVAANAGLSVASETAITPFVRCFILEKASAT